MNTKMTELFKIQHPIMLAGMNWLTTPRLVAAVSNAGGLGLLSCQQYNPDSLRSAVKKIRELTGKPLRREYHPWDGERTIGEGHH